LGAANDYAVEHLHGFNGNEAEDRAQVFPELSFGNGHFPCGIEKGAAQLLNLVNHESQHHEHHEDPTQVLLAQTVVVLKVVSLVFEGIEGFVFHLPPSTACAHDGIGVFPSKGEIRNPAKVLGALGAFFPVFQDIDQKILIGCVDGHTVHKAKEMMHLGFLWILEIVFNGLASFNGSIQTS